MIVQYYYYSESIYLIIGWWLPGRVPVKSRSHSSFSWATFFETLIEQPTGRTSCASNTTVPTATVVVSRAKRAATFAIIDSTVKYGSRWPIISTTPEPSSFPPIFFSSVRAKQFRIFFALVGISPRRRHPS